MPLFSFEGLTPRVLKFEDLFNDVTGKLGA